MITNGTPSSDQIIGEVDRILKADPGARSFELRVIPAGVRRLDHIDAWAVPIASGAAGGSSYDLMRAIERIQELAEQKTQLELSIYLDPFAA
jgi:hypothetical protein